MIKFITSFFKPTPKPVEVREEPKPKKRYGFSSNLLVYGTINGVFNLKDFAPKTNCSCDACRCPIRNFLKNVNRYAKHLKISTPHVCILDSQEGLIYLSQYVEGKDEITDYLPIKLDPINIKTKVIGVDCHLYAEVKHNETN